MRYCFKLEKVRRTEDGIREYLCQAVDLIDPSCRQVGIHGLLSLCVVFFVDEVVLLLFSLEQAFPFAFVMIVTWAAVN